MFSSAHPSPSPASLNAHAPPTKANLKAWWNHFNFVQKTKKEVFTEPYRAHDTADHPVFGKPLKESLRYASVQISTADANGELYVWGYIPVVVAKCGLYLKENATEVQGTFRVNGSNKRMRELQAAFETPPRYGKSIDWKNETYTTHDVASVFRRYLTQMPEPVIPYDMYHLFRNALAKQPYNQEEVITTYKALIRRMPRPNQYLLLYVLDLLSVFARKSDKNLMTATNLAVIFRPGIIAHPEHEMSPQEHMLSQKVLEFLIAQQDWFMLDIVPPPPPGGFPGDDNGNDSAQGGIGGGADGSPGAGPSSRGASFGGGGSTGKWREGTSTPTRQGTMDSAWEASPEAGPSSSRLNTTRQRVISGGPDAHTWYAHGRSSGSALGHGRTAQISHISPPSQRTASHMPPQIRPRSPPLPPTPQGRHTPQVPDQQSNSYFNMKRASRPSAMNPSTNVPESQWQHLDQRDAPDGGEIFTTPMSSLPPSPAETSVSVRVGGSSSGHSHGRQGPYPNQQDQQQHKPHRHRQREEQQQPQPQKPKTSRRSSLPANPAPVATSVQPNQSTRDLGPTPIHAKFHSEPHSATGTTSAAHNSSPQFHASHATPPTALHHSQQPIHTHTAGPHPQQQIYQSHMRSGSSPLPSPASETFHGFGYTVAPPLGSGASDVDDIMIISSEEEEFSHIGDGGWKLVPNGYPSDGARVNGNGGFMSLGGKKIREKDRSKERERARDKEERERIRQMRRRTAMDRTELLAKSYDYSGSSPIQELPPDTPSNGGAVFGVVRSRTLPSRRKNADGSVEDKENTQAALLGINSGQPYLPPTLDIGPKEKKERGEKRVLKKQRRVSSANRA